ncbi:3'-5' exonuclease [Gloeothece citriformis PCC 7424]|uniref:3'-5' exonuclease n=1 Tax=Gloeothece citriformis (strain PCC 7424) TaxID=65393 RepID=B7KA11_GLOC7|nr:3'-5' exonuclease [Gloeothece citriformis]ACK71367.1 3'-5' exonuclease [Gloeothece citriformis PCC 7424]
MLYFTQSEDIQALIDDLTEVKILWLDTESTDLNSKKSRLSLIQVLAYPEDTNGSRTYIFDVLDNPDIVDYFIEKIMVNDQINKIFHNAQHDLQFLGGKKAKNVTCTLKLSKTIPYHILPVPNHTLKTLTEYLTDFKNVSKEEQTSDWSQRPLSQKQLDYAKMDPVYLAHIHGRLLELNQQSNPDPNQDNLTEIGKRYQEIKPEWQLLKSEIDNLETRAKNAMKAQNQTENFAFTLSSYDRTTIKVDFAELAQIVINQGIDLHFSITLDKNLQKQLGELLNQLSLKKETIQSWRLTSKDLEEDSEEEIF